MLLLGAVVVLAQQEKCSNFGVVISVFLLFSDEFIFVSVEAAIPTE